jgi:hypothetical protein
VEVKEIKDGNTAYPDRRTRRPIQRNTIEKHRHSCLQKQTGMEIENGRVEIVFG